MKLLRSDPLLQTLVTVDAVEQPLGDVLSGLNPVLKLDLTAEQRVSDQRVTVHVTGQPVYVLMGQIISLLSHDVGPPHGYHWGSLDRPAGKRPDYQLWRDAASVAQEQEARDYPRRELAVYLRDLRHLAQLPPRELAAYPSDYSYKDPDPDDTFNKAFRSLTDDQIDALVDGEPVPLDPSPFVADIAAFRQQSRDRLAQLHAHARATKRPDLYPEDIPLTAPALRVVPADEEEDGEFLGQVGKFEVHLDGVRDDALVLNTYDTAKDRDPSFSVLQLPADSGPRVDLAPYLAAKTVTPQQKGDLGFTLQALGRAAHLNIYQESFLKTSVLNGLQHPGLSTLQGSVPRLIAQICALWNFHAEPVPGGYLFWSRTWALDRGLDVPERLIAPWRRRLQKTGNLSLYDRSDICATLTWPQVALTLNPALPEAGGLDSVFDYRILNLFGSLTPLEQAQSLSPDGLPVSGMSARGQAALASDYQSRLQAIPGDQLARAVLRFQTEDAPEFKVQRLILSVDESGHRLLDGRGVISVKPIPPAPPSAARTPAATP